MPPPPLSRRTLLRSSLAAGLFGALESAQTQAATPATGWLLLGNGTPQGIYRARWNARTGEIGPAELAVATPHPSFLAVHPRLPVLYACNEQDAPAASVSAFTLDRKHARLSPLAKQPTGGSDPCYVSTDRSGHLLFAANYTGGSLSVFPLDPGGQPGPAATLFDCNTSGNCGAHGPVPDRQTAPHLHCATLSPEGRFILACDLGDDAILAFPLAPGTTHPLGPVTRLAASPGSGPRHLAFHPNGRWLYCINELGCTVGLYLWGPQGETPAAEMVPGATVNIRPPNAPQQPASTAAELAITRDGTFLYTSTRFSDVLTAFRIDPQHGHLTQIQQLPCGGKTPRFFSLDPTERWLLCANQDSDTISVFGRDRASGRLTPANIYPAPNPQCILWL